MGRLELATEILRRALRLVEDGRLADADALAEQAASIIGDDDHPQARWLRTEAYRLLRPESTLPE